MNDFLSRLFDEPHTWPTWVRRAYLMVWPFAALLRFAIAFALLIVCGAIVLIGNTFIRVRAIWRGEKPKIPYDWGSV